MPNVAAKPANRRAKGKQPRRSVSRRTLSAYDRLKPFIGVISGPGDLSTNPKYMEGYGKSRRP